MSRIRVVPSAEQETVDDRYRGDRDDYSKRKKKPGGFLGELFD